MFTNLAFGPVFVGAPLAVFAAEHFVLGASMIPMVPAWLPTRVFWVYLFGCGLLAGATGLVTRKFLRPSAALLAVLFLLLVLLLHLPNAFAALIKMRLTKSSLHSDGWYIYPPSHAR